MGDLPLLTGHRRRYGTPHPPLPVAPAQCRRFDILPDNGTAGAGTGDPGEIDAQLGGKATGQR
jgi:hypothetical protein